MAGANRIYNNGVEGAFIAVFPPSEDTLRERIKKTKKLSTVIVNNLLEVAFKEIKEMDECSFFTSRIVNDDLGTGYEDFKNVVLSSFPKLHGNYDEIMKIAEEMKLNKHLETFNSEENVENDK